MAASQMGQMMNNAVWNLGSAYATQQQHNDALSRQYNALMQGQGLLGGIQGFGGQATSAESPAPRKTAKDLIEAQMRPASREDYLDLLVHPALNPALTKHVQEVYRAFDMPKEEEVALTKEQRPQGWKAGLVIVAAALIAFKLWKNRDEIFVNLEKMASDLGGKLGIGDLPTSEEKK